MNLGSLTGRLVLYIYLKYVSLNDLFVGRYQHELLNNGTRNWTFVIRSESLIQ